MVKILIARSVVEKALKALYEADSLMEHHTNIELRRSALVELRAALEQPQDHTEQNLNMVPEGWKLVPVEPTSEMLDAGRNACEGRFYPQDMLHGPRAMMADSWAAMLDAAPQPPVVEQPKGEQEPVGEAGSMPGTDGFTMACFRASDVPVGTKLYTHPQPQREPLTEADLYDIAGNYFADEWAQKQAVMMLKDHGIGGEE